MLSLIDTAIGFIVIMLLLSFLIKSLTSVVKNHVQYYRQNLVTELERVLQPILGAGIKKLEEQFPGIDWRNVGEELLDKKNLEPILKKIKPDLDLSDLEARLKVHKAALSFAFDRRMKNLSLACGTALCLILNINALSIWTNLYKDTEVRAKFASDTYVGEVLKKAEEAEKQEQAQAGSNPPAEGVEASATNEGGAQGQDQEDLAEQRQAWKDELRSFRQEVDFGIGAVWKKQNPRLDFVLYELIGSLLTGFLASIGAPYMHDLLKALASFRQRGAPAAAAEAPPTS